LKPCPNLSYRISA